MYATFFIYRIEAVMTQQFLGIDLFFFSFDRQLLIINFC